MTTDLFGFVLRTDPPSLDKSKKDNHESVNNVETNKEKIEKKNEIDKSVDRYDDSKKSERDKGRDRDRDRSPHYKRKYSRSPSPRRSRHRRSRTRSRSPRESRRRRGGSSERYRYRRYSSEKSPDKSSDKSDVKSSSPRRDRSRTPSQGWRGGSHTRSNPVDTRNPSINVNNRQDYVQMVPPPFHPAGVNPVPPPSTTSGGSLPPLPEGNNFNRYSQNTAAPVPPPPQYNYGPGPGNSGSESYPGYNVYYPGYPPPPPPAHPQPEYMPPASNNWQREPTSKPPPPPVPPEDPAKKEAIEKELLQQKITLSKQRDSYLRKGVVLNRELELLKSQKKELVGDKTGDSEKLLKANNKLQLEINSKLKAVDNVIDILTGIIGDERPTIPFDEKCDIGKTSGRESSKEKEKSGSREKEKKKSEKRSKDSSDSGDPSSSEDSSSDSDSDYRKKKKSKAKKRRKADSNDESLAPPGTETVASVSDTKKEECKPLYNYIYYDPEMYWCQVCDEFPRTAKEYLNHLHSKEHKEMTQEKKLNNMPWHDLNAHEEVPFYEGAPTKRIPIKGLQFFVSATAWFCKLCRMWIGDLHCASLHLKSKEHLVNYSSFNEQNPHWETDWMANREKSYEKCAEKRRRQRDEELLQKQKEERMELMKKQEEELKQKFFSSLVKPESSETDLIMPLTLPRNFENQSTPAKEIPEIKKEKEKKKKSKKEKKKKEKKSKEKKKKSKEKKSKKSSSSDSGTSTDTSSESTDSEDEKKYKKDPMLEIERSKSVRSTMRKQEKPEEEKLPEPIPITLPEKSKWEMDDVSDTNPVSLTEKKESEVKEYSRKNSVDEKSGRDERESEREMSRNLKEKRRSKDRDRDWRKSDDDRSSRYDRKRSYRDKRQESSRRERRSSRDRKKDYRSSRYRRSRTRSRSRSKSRSREREKVTPGVIPAPLINLFKLSDKKNPADSKPEKPPERLPENDDGESKFEKQAMEAAKKKKVQPVVNLPKSKFVFIGRMPFAKKKTEEKGKKDDDTDLKEESMELEAPPPPRITQPRPPSPKGPKPVLTNKTKVETAKEIVSKYQKAFQERIEESNMPLEQLMAEMVNPLPPPLPPPPPALTLPMMPPSPPKIKETPKSPKKTKKSPYPLPKDFQDALSIIYPEEKPDDKTEGYPTAEMMLSYQQAMGYGGQMMMYPGMMMAGMPQMAAASHMMNVYNQAAPPLPASDPSTEVPSPPAMPPPPENLFETSFGLGSSTGAAIPGLEEEKAETSSKVSDDDMALLGIDAEDLAAQQL